MKPFLKWAGGKSRLVDRIEALLPDGERKRFVEPFVGSASVFLGMQREYESYLLADVNPDLISLYTMVMDDAELFIDECATLFGAETNTLEAFTRLRAEFNSLKPGDSRRAQIFIYLNRHAFNGLCRYNGSGGFNVPYGRYKNPSFPDEALRGFATKTMEHRPEFVVADFRTVLGQVEAGDVVYCDPPYVPLSPTASFASYAVGGFSAKDHKELAELCFACADRGATVLLSNHDTKFTRWLYAGARFTAIDVRRNISCRGEERNHAPEVFVLFAPGCRMERDADADYQFPAAV